MEAPAPAMPVTGVPVSPPVPGGASRRPRRWTGQATIVALCLLHGALYGLIPAVAALLDPSRPATWSQVGYTTLTFLPWALVLPGVLAMVRRLRPSRVGWWVATGAHLAAFGASVALQIGASWGYLALVRGPAAPGELLHRWLTGMAPSYTLTVHLGIVALAVAWDNLQRGRRQATAAARLRRQLARERLDGLRRRLDPHDLLAGLEALGELAETDPAAGERRVVELGDRLRHSLRRPRQWRETAGAIHPPNRAESATAPGARGWRGRRLAAPILLSLVILGHGFLYGLLPVLSGQWLGDGQLGWRYVLFTTVTSLHWLALAPLVHHLVRRFPPARVGWAACLGVHTLGLLFTLGVSFGVSWLYHAFVDPQSFRAMVEVFVFGMEVSYHFTFYLVITAAVAAWELDRRRRRRQIAALELEGRLAEARLAALRRRLHPHFLFNALHTVAALMRRDGAAARRALRLLEDLLRRALEHTDDTTPLVRLEEELSFLARYLAMERLRFGGRLSVRVRVSRQSRRAQLPPMILQPLVENAVHHGLGRQERGTVEIDARRRGDRLVVEITDDGPGPASGAGEGLGWQLTRARLQAAFGAGVEAVLEPRLAGGSVARLEFPYRPA